MGSNVLITGSLVAAMPSTRFARRPVLHHAALVFQRQGTQDVIGGDLDADEQEP
jgi:hypothetical protein